MEKKVILLLTLGHFSVWQNICSLNIPSHFSKQLFSGAIQLHKKEPYQNFVSKTDSNISIQRTENYTTSNIHSVTTRG